MVAIRILDFKGMIPAKSDELLPRTYASYAKNTKLLNGKIQSFKGVQAVNKPSKAGTKQTIYRWGSVAGKDAEGVITGATQANPVSITSVGHGRTTGERVFISGVVGMTEINDLTFAITVTGVDTFTLDGVNGTGYAAYTSGGYWFYENGYWFHWTTLVNIVKGAIAADTTERVYYTGDGGPKMTYSPIAVSGGGTDYPNNSYNLGVPAPATAATVVLVDRTGSIIDATKSNPVAIESTAHGLEDNDLVLITGVGGMTEINDREFRVTVINADIFYLDAEDGVNHTTYTSGGTWKQIYDEGDIEERTYVYTYVSVVGEEGPPSPDSVVVAAGFDQQVDLSAMDTGPGGGYNLDRKRIYRLNTGTFNAEYQYVDEIALAVTTYNDTKKDSELNEILPTEDWLPPPTDLKGLISLPNGVLAGISKNQVCMSVPNMPHAWPTDYKKTTDYEPVGLGYYLQTIVVCTRGLPYVMSAVDPLTTTPAKAQLEQACVSEESIVSLGDLGVAYASQDGLIAIGVNGIRIATDDYFTRDQWSDFNPKSIRGFYYNNQYIGFYDNGTTQAGFIFDPFKKNQAFVHLGLYADGGWTDVETDSLYLIIDDKVQRFDSLSLLSHEWQSKAFRASSPINLGAAQVIAESYTDLTFKLYADDVLKHTEVVTNGEIFPLPDGYLATRYYANVSGTDVVKQILLGETPDDIAGLPNE